MAKAKKEKEKQLNLPQDAQPLDGCDFCMQFDYDEPHVIGASEDSDGVMELVIKAYLDAGVTFVCPTTQKKLRIYARPLSDTGRAILDQQAEVKKD
jgi:hypothetical protein